MKKTRIMYIEPKPDALGGPARIGRVTFSRSGNVLSYRGRQFQPFCGVGLKANYCDRETRDAYWISGCKRRGGDRLYSGTIEIDEDVREVNGPPRVPVLPAANQQAS